MSTHSHGARERLQVLLHPEDDAPTLAMLDDVGDCLGLSPAQAARAVLTYAASHYPAHRDALLRATTEAAESGEDTP